MITILSHITTSLLPEKKEYQSGTNKLCLKSEAGAGSSSTSPPAETLAIAETCQGLTPMLGSSLFGCLSARVKLSLRVKNKKEPTSLLKEKVLLIICILLTMAEVLTRHSSDNVAESLLSPDGDQRLGLGFDFLWIHILY